jgi:hypothetical protein
MNMYRRKRSSDCCLSPIIDPYQDLDPDRTPTAKIDSMTGVNATAKELGNDTYPLVSATGPTIIVQTLDRNPKRKVSSALLEEVSSVFFMRKSAKKDSHITDLRISSVEVVSIFPQMLQFTARPISLTHRLPVFAASSSSISLNP